MTSGKIVNLYIIKSWSVVFIVIMLLLTHISGHIIYLFSTFFFLFLNFYSPYFKKKKKKLFFSLLVHIYYYIASNLSPLSFPLYFSTTPYFTVTISSSFSLFYILTLLFPILFCINSIPILSFNPYFSHKKLWVLSLSLLKHSNLIRNQTLQQIRLDQTQILQ